MSPDHRRQGGPAIFAVCGVALLTGVGPVTGSDGDAIVIDAIKRT